MLRYTFSDLVAIIKEQLEKICVNKERYTIYQKYDDKDESGLARVLYDKAEVVTFHFLITNKIVNGHKTVSSQIVLYACPYPKWYFYYIRNGKQKDVFVNEFFNANTDGSNWRPLNYFLDTFLPIEKKDDVDVINRIASENSTNVQSVICDTYRKAYILKVDIVDLLNLKNIEEKIDNEGYMELYKYVSLETFRCMLNYGTFRMNSMIAMNDVYEGIWLHNLIYGNSKLDDSDYYISVIRQRNTLITSFTNKLDDADMWRFYGDNGRGVCLCFKVKREKVNRVIYTDKENKGINNLRKTLDALTKKGFNIIVEDIKGEQYVVKSSSFSSEGEYRYTYYAKDDEIELENYNGLLSPYKDFKYNPQTGLYDDLPFKLNGIFIGHNIPYFFTNMPLIIDIMHQRFPHAFAYESKIKELR